MSDMSAPFPSMKGIDNARLRSFIPPPPPAASTLHSQRLGIAATLAAGLIAADHTRPATVENAVALMRQVYAEIWPEKESGQ